jgi:Phage integrase, N-terminal SAM-like domain
VAEKIAKLLDNKRSGLPVPDRAWKLGQWLSYWLEHVVQPNREPTTYNTYESKVRLDLVPKLGKTPRTKLTPAMVRKMLADLRPEKPEQRATHAEALRTLRNALVDMPTATNGTAGRLSRAGSPPHRLMSAVDVNRHLLSRVGACFRWWG